MAPLDDVSESREFSISMEPDENTLCEADLIHGSALTDNSEGDYNRMVDMILE